MGASFEYKGLNLKCHTTLQTGVSLPNDEVIIDTLPNEKECVVRQVEDRINKCHQRLNKNIFMK